MLMERFFIETRCRCEKKIIQDRPRPLLYPKFLVTLMLTRDLFAVANLVCCRRHLRCLSGVTSHQLWSNAAGAPARLCSVIITRPHIGERDTHGVCRCRLRGTRDGAIGVMKGTNREWGVELEALKANTASTVSIPIAVQTSY